MSKLKLLTMSDIPAEEVRWLWYPYLPRGKITIIQGDPGEGKTTFVLALASLLTRGLPAPGNTESQPPMNIIYQTAEDGLADTVKPRLTALGADCSRVLVIDESERELTLSDRRLAQAIQETGAGLLVLDPIQAYLGDGVDMHRANEVRPIFKRLGQLAEQTGCAIVLVGHMNKMQGAKSAYRGLGSIDFRAAARSVLLVGRSKDDAETRVVVHDKSSLAPEGASILFSLHADTGFSWSGFCDTTASELLSGSSPAATKTEQAERLLLELLEKGEVSSEELVRRSSALGISERTLKIAKQNQGVVSVRRGGRWYAKLPDTSQEGKGVMR
ncbi:AAA family ATPase [uncultured Oscillibacter sp.]|uniref:AAA family ATPase n=1 Tax=uncultured Oscillibacter sp. TaxID=876091 RepID=UPI00262107C6|nr:AAA family ATPase [uncultured Oscillibacter sp.]